MCSVWKIAKYPTGQIWKSSREDILQKWDFIDFFVPPSKAIKQILLKTAISQFHCDSRGWAVKWISCWHITDCVIFPFWIKKETKQEREQWWRARKQRDSLFQSLLISMTAGAGLSQGQDSHRRGIRWESKIHHQGNDFWADQENLDPILGFFVVFLSREIRSSDTGI